MSALPARSARRWPAALLALAMAAACAAGPPDASPLPEAALERDAGRSGVGAPGRDLTSGIDRLVDDVGSAAAAPSGDGPAPPAGPARAARPLPPREGAIWSGERLREGDLLRGSYGYNFGGGFLRLESGSDDFSFNVQNQLTLDGTFYSLENPDTLEKNFNIPFYRLYFYGDFLDDWEYLASVQQSLGAFNILDLYLGYRLADGLRLRVGHFLSPFLYEYWAFSPAWEPVITNSPLFQLAGKRQTGAMLWGRVADDAFQYQAGVFNGPAGAYFDVDGNLDVAASLTWTPLRPARDAGSGDLGLGVSVQSGRQHYLLSAGPSFNFPSGNGEATLNQNFVNSSGIPFLTYADDVAADGPRVKIAPHLFWFGRMSVLAEYVRWSRALDNGSSEVTETIDAWYANVSWFVTGERYTGDGLMGYTTIRPLDRRLGAWELVAQYAEIGLGDSVLTPGFALPGQDATRLRQLMAGVNWWANPFVRVSVDYVAAWTNRPVEVGTLVGGGPQSADTYGIWWARLAAFF